MIFIHQIINPQTYLPKTFTVRAFLMFEKLIDLLRGNLNMQYMKKNEYLLNYSKNVFANLLLYYEGLWCF